MKQLLSKTGLGLATIAIILAGAAAFSAFEAHVINVTARIENALNVPINELQFGTMFPQEQATSTFDVLLSDSFLAEDRVDDVDYVINQKPKCILVSQNSVDLPQFGRVTEVNGEFVCEDEVHYDIMPLLCPYLSKSEVTKDGRDVENDGQGIEAFHGLPGPWTLATTLANQVKGHLAKAVEDIADRWAIDLKVPCFRGGCAQDWASFVRGINPSANPDDYAANPNDESKVFGCDLWLEVRHISLPGFGCVKELDMMLVLDRSGSIDSTELGTLKDAANAFVTALAPTAGGVHMGQSSFSTTGSLDLHLTGVEADVHAAINALVSGGFTNLKEGIELADGELADAHEHERVPVPDVMVVITDGRPNRPNGNEILDKAAAAAAADAARAAGVEVFVVGVGSDVDAAFLSSEIADDASHYFSAANFDDLQAVLEDLVKCEE